MRLSIQATVSIASLVLFACSGADANGNPNASEEQLDASATSSARPSAPLPATSETDIRGTAGVASPAASATNHARPSAAPSTTPEVVIGNIGIGSLIPLSPPPGFTDVCASMQMAQSTVVLSGGQSATLVYGCYPYACQLGLGTCADQCTSNTQCSSGAVCVSGQCLPGNPYHCQQYSNGSWSEVNAAGVASSCGNYACNQVTGLCYDNCENGGTSVCTSAVGGDGRPIVCDETQNPARCVDP
jgi:hypothetical protein